MSRESFYFLMLFNLFILSFPLFFSVEGSYNFASELEILPSSNKFKFGSSSACFGFRVLCPDSASLCFPSAKPDFLVGSSDQPETGNTNLRQSVSFSLSNGGQVTCSSVESKATNGVHKRSFGGGYNTASCQAPLIPDDWMKASNGVTTDLEEGSTKDAETVQVNRSPSSLNVEINPPLLDWGINSLYVASILTLTLTNFNKDSVLHVYEPYCTDPQFYPYNFDEVSLEPGENASISFVFLPRNIGLSSAQIVLQTNIGGFVLPAKGDAVESPYNIEPLVGIDLHISGFVSKTLSIHNPFEESIYVEEVAVWMSASESVSQSNHAICQLDMLATSSSEIEWFNMGNKWNGLLRADLRPINRWEVLPKNGDAVLELRLQADSEGKVLGAICMKLRNGASQKFTTVVVPLEVQVHGDPIHSALTDQGSVSAFFKSYAACDGSGLIFSLYLKNDEFDSLRVVNIFEERKGEAMFEIRYLKNLVLFPASTTAIALISLKSGNVLSEISGAELHCNVVVETNSSSSAFIRIPCQDFARSSSSNAGGSDLASVPEGQHEEAINTKARSFGGILGDLTEEKNNPSGEVDASNLILTDWISHGKAAETSHLINQLVLFPPVNIGSHFSQPIIVKNPGPIPAIVQLILNSEELITECKTSDDDLSEHTFLTRSPEISATEIRFGFSIADSGLREVVLHPFETASLGPVIFHPSSRCTWSSLALIRSNMSGIEWVSLRASGGLHSISLLEGSEPIWKLEFKLDAGPVKNISSSLQPETTCPSCDYQFSKDIYAKNTGELPLEIKKVRVSGTDCKSDGFSISQNCLGFNLSPGESELIRVLYKPDLSSGLVQRDLELVMSGGIFIIPMKVQVPVCMVGQCRRMFAYWRVSFFLLMAASVFAVVLMFVRVMPLSLTLGSNKCYFRLDNSDRCNGQDDNRLVFHHTTKASRSVAREQKKQDSPFMAKYPICQSTPKVVDTDLISSDPLKKPATSSYSSLKPTKDPVATTFETPQSDNTNNLTIKVVREKGKRRKKRAPSNNSNLAAKLEVSSSHSGNSTPSSPLSPSGSTPKQSWLLSPNSDPTANPFKPSSATEEVKMTNKIVNEPAYFPSLVFSGPHVNNSIFLAKTSPIAPHARAPGPKVVKEKSSKREENEVVSTKEFTYDMWADHLSGHFMYTDGRDADPSKSFFAIQPQAPPSYSGNLNKNGFNGNVTGVSGMN
ncbi:hypothetical protein LUZ61_006278 [Rhynchospora tenuis]|uniref:Transmembrane protein 131-like N-terminal domain-containing protein n=1 Tax=Rhynchospora tenuis TaxID=198213 RepID=A0AAD5ZRE2_9POAL|nr:hypothetical protein LUZ61_006278 [Rhynchospora tenuis]